MGYAEGFELFKVTLTEEFSGPSSGTQHLFLTDFHKDGVRSDLADFIPGNDKFLVRTKKAAETKRAGNHDGTDASLAFVKNQVVDPAQTPAVASVDDVLFP